MKNRRWRDRFISCLIALTLVISGYGSSDIYEAKQLWNSMLGKLQREKIVPEMLADEDLKEQ